MSGSQADMPFKILVDAFERIEATTSRIQMTNLLSALFKSTPSEVIDKVVYLIQGKLWPDWKKMPELGIGEKMIIKAISLATYTPERQVEALSKSLGDLGKAAESLKAKAGARALVSYTQGAPAKELAVSKVYNTLVKIAMAQGEGSKDLKTRLLAGLLTEASPKEAKFLIRFVEGRLKIGIGEATIMDALGLAYGGGDFARPIIERAYNLRADLGEIARILASPGLEALKNIKPEVGTPIRPMLAERLSDPKEILEKVGGKCFVEYKYDGERAQIHKKQNKVVIYSRRLEDITYQYPDVVKLVQENLKADEAIVEGEIVAYDPDTEELRPFQELMHRKRKYDIHKMVREIPVMIFLFDLLYLNGEDYTNRPLPIRRQRLVEVVNQTDEFRIAEYVETDSPDELYKFFLKAIEEGAEGVVVKALHEEAIYQAGMRGWLWIKFKRDYRSEMIDTVDLVVVGAFHGKGKRGGKIGTLLMAAYNSEKDVFETVCKVGTGFKDEDLDKMHDLLKPYIADKRPARVVSNIEPDIWVYPTLVAEIIGAELTLSPVHTCAYGKVKVDAGISIRFPRFIRWRSDKSPEDATTTEELVEMYLRQLKKVSTEAQPTEAP